MVLLLAGVSVLGAWTRFWLERNSVKRFGEHWPWGTFAANLVGSFILGFAFAKSLDSTTYYLVSAYCGAFTTFGGFVGQTYSRVRHAATRRDAVIYLLLSVIGSLFAAWIGTRLA